MTADVVVIGAGAAGGTAAAFAAGAGARVLLLERTADGGRKILISGGGRCNVLPSTLAADRFVTSSSRNTLRKILRSWPLEGQRTFFEDDLGIPLSLEAETGKLFPTSGRAREVRDRLFEHARRQGATLRFETPVTDVRRLDETVGEAPDAAPVPGARWRVSLASGEVVEGRAVVLATGGLSVPKTGSDGTGMTIARALGHTLVEPYPALTPLVADPAVHASLAGISLDVELRATGVAGEARAKGGFLFTHLGYSGPAVLDVSHMAVLSRRAGAERAEIVVRWSPVGRDEWDERLRTGKGTVASAVRSELPSRLADTLIAEAGVDPTLPLSRLRREERTLLVRVLAEYELPWTGDEGYRKAEVTGGGVPLGEVDPATLESRVVPGLFLCGEILDAFGPIGGYNFAWAWATGRAAGLGAARHTAFAPLGTFARGGGA